MDEIGAFALKCTIMRAEYFENHSRNLSCPYIQVPAGKLRFSDIIVGYSYRTPSPNARALHHHTSPRGTCINFESIVSTFFRLGAVACACNPATWKSEVLDCLSSGPLRVVVLWRSSVHAKFRINRVDRTEVWSSWLSKEGRTGPGRKRSRQKSPCGTVAGSHL